LLLQRVCITLSDNWTADTRESDLPRSHIGLEQLRPERQ
jgi:hypothetical protein